MERLVAILCIYRCGNTKIGAGISEIGAFRCGFAVYMLVFGDFGVGFGEGKGDLFKRMGAGSGKGWVLDGKRTGFGAGKVLV